MKSIVVTCAMAILVGFSAPGFTQDSAASSAAAVAQGDNPNVLIEKVAQEVLNDLDANREQYRKNPKTIRQLVDKHLLPHFDTEYAARLVLAKHWRTATPEQRKRFIEAFYQSLLQNYGEALLDFTPDRLKVLPYREDPTNKDRATVRTEVRRDNGQTVPVNYSLHRTPSGWKAWDVTIENISYIKTFRLDFDREIQQKGLDAVIARLEARVSSGQVPKPGANGAATSGS
jgi:phospholipid transport system substrate-binding protein